MTKMILIACLVLSGALLLACTKTETNSNTNAAAPANRPATTAASPAATTTAAAGEKIGIAECDDFLTAYENCVNNKVPAASRAQFNSGLATWRKQWHDLAANPQTRGTLAKACKAQLDTAKTSMKSFGCTF
jgi:hypothetical protein